MKQSKWIISDHFSLLQIQKFAEELRVSEIIAKVLLNRGIDTFEDAKAFFRPTNDSLHDPFLMKDMLKSVQRLEDALKNKEKILICGDFDVDGITATSILYQYIYEKGGNVDFYIPDRFSEGYGFSRRGVQKGIQSDARLILTVDCGISSHEEISFAVSQNIDIIVCDHHEPPDKLPPAYAILNPKRKDCPYPFKELAAIGVVLKLIQAIFIHFKEDVEGLMSYIDLAALGTIADIVPLFDENRFIVKEGLAKLNSNPHPGIKELLIPSGMKPLKTLDTYHILFIIAPRLNASGRLGQARDAVELLISKDSARRRELAAFLERQNRKRRSIEEDTLREALVKIDEEVDLNKDKAIVLAQENWHPGVIGIVANKIMDRFYRPTILISLNENEGRGSARSITGFDMFQALKSCSVFLSEYGGHQMAAGMKIELNQLEEFRKAFLDVARQLISTEMLTPVLEIDDCITLDKIDVDLVRLLKAFEPCGCQNKQPLFTAENLQVVGYPTIVTGNHLKFNVRQGEKILPVIAFGMGDYYEQVTTNLRPLNLAFTINENEWGGRKEIQLIVKDIRVGSL